MTTPNGKQYFAAGAIARDTFALRQIAGAAESFGLPSNRQELDEAYASHHGNRESSLSTLNDRQLSILLEGFVAARKWSRVNADELQQDGESTGRPTVFGFDMGAMAMMAFLFTLHFAGQRFPSSLDKTLSDEMQILEQAWRAAIAERRAGGPPPSSGLVLPPGARG